MLKRNITYENFDGETVTEVFYFNLTKTEIIDMQMSYEGGLDAVIQRIVKAEDIKSLIEEFQNIVLMSYGQRSDDGKYFRKSDSIREEFKHHAAYDSLFMELATDDKAAADFMIGILPRDMAQDLPKDHLSKTPTVINTPPLPPQVS